MNEPKLLTMITLNKIDVSKELMLTTVTYIPFCNLETI